MTDAVSVALARDEILQVWSKIVVNVPPEADASEVVRAIGVPEVAGSTTLVAPGRFSWTAQSAIPPGRHTFVVGALANAAQQPISGRIEIPFYVVETRAQFPAGARVESFTRMRLTPQGFQRLDPKSIPDGEFIELLKAVSRDTGRTEALGFDQDGRQIDAELQLQGHRQRLAAARGKLDAGLQTQLSLLAPDEGILIDAWFSIEEPRPVRTDRPQDVASDLTRFRGRSLELIKRIRDRAQEIVDELGKGLTPGVVTFQNPEDRAPVLTLRVPSEQVRRISAHEAIKAIYIHEERAILDLGTSIAIAGSDIVHEAGQRGEGVRVAVWEGPPFVSPSFDALETFHPPPPPIDTDLHSTIVHDIIRNKGKDAPHGHAPDCNLVSANSLLREALTWAVGDGNCSVVNQSFHLWGEASSSTLSSDDHYCDWLAAHEPYPLIVRAAGNMLDDDAILPPEEEYVNHKGYNTLIVASHDDVRAVASSSVFRNPSTPHGDRELPEISASGTLVAEGMKVEGTSFAAPAVSAAAALIQGTAPLLVQWPEGCRAILLAGAGPRDSVATWWQDVLGKVDAKDGAGPLDANESFEIAKCRSARGAAATHRGWDVDLLAPEDLDANGKATFSYQLSVPGDGEDPSSVRVVIAWCSRTGEELDYWRYLSVDLDLYVYDSNGIDVGHSCSWDNSYEIVQFDGLPGATYQIMIQSRAPAESTWYGIAWTTGRR
jgi:hypothetical protein